ncbi:MAG: glutamate racemase [Pseudomonadota bacterium]
MPVGVFDSGLGGLTIHEAISSRLPEQAIVYFGDNKNTPYGTRDPEQIYQFTRDATQRLFDAGCDLVILACNTASAVALKRMQENWLPADKRVLGVFVPMIEALTERRWGDDAPPREVKVKQVALFATPATVATRAFQRELAFRAIGVDVEAQPCAGLVDALEDNDRELAEAMVQSHVQALKRRMPNPQAAVLGCTHYPILKDVFQTALGPQVRLFSQANLVAESLDDYLRRHPERGQGGSSRMLTSGDPSAVSLAATRFLGKQIHFEAA